MADKCSRNVANLFKQNSEVKRLRSFIYEFCAVHLFWEKRFFHQRANFERDPFGWLQNEGQGALITFADTYAAAHTLFQVDMIDAIHHFERMELTIFHTIATTDAQIFIHL